MTAVALDDVERRVLGNLPVWRNDADLAEAIRLETHGHDDDEIGALTAKPTAKKDLPEGTERDEREGTDEDPRIVKGVGHSIQSYTAEEMLVRLRDDDQFPMYLAKQVIADGVVPRPLDAELVIDELTKLESRGLATVTGEGPSGVWMMTEDGRDSLTYNGEEPLT